MFAAGGALMLEELGLGANEIRVCGHKAERSE